ncbi:hypothetical protein Tco_1476331 [Tanacetum coccineum]
MYLATAYREIPIGFWIVPWAYMIKVEGRACIHAFMVVQGHADGIETRNTDVTLGSSHEVRSLGDELRPLRDELRLLGAGVRLYGTKDKPHRSEARARRLDHDNGVETRVYGQRLRDEETIVMVFGRSMYSRTMI